MKTSARNTFEGIVTRFTKKELLSEVVLETSDGAEVVAVITTESFNELGTQTGIALTAHVKATWVILVKDDSGVVTSARNRFRGTVKTIKRGDIVTEVIISLDRGEEACALITVESLDSMPLAKGDVVFVLFKAFSVSLNAES